MRLVAWSVVASVAVSILVAPPAIGMQQTARVYRVGVLTVPLTPEVARRWEPLRQGLRELGYIDGQNLAIEWRWAEGAAGWNRPAAELVALKPDVIVVLGAPPARAVKEAANGRIPIVFSNVGDPVALGLVRDLAHPHGNLTGVNNLSVEITAKRLELLKDLLPPRSRIAFLWNPNNPVGAAALDNARAASQILGVSIEAVAASTTEQLRNAFAHARRPRVAGVLVLPDPFFYAEAALVARLALDAGLPSVFELREWVDAGGLLAYGASLAINLRRVAYYVHRILSGTRPADLPVEQPTELQFIINLKTAKALGLTIPPSMMLRADHVIE